MTPKEKAEELTSKYLWPQRKFNELAKVSVAKECALVSVEEIINALKITTGHLTIKPLVERFEVEQDFNYWDEVKQEIEKL